jgi:sugar O-acyltransferase (sialic acid O-acetyltransferase NeuD family)
LSLKKLKINKNIYIIGAGGHAFSCIDVIESSGYTIKGIYALEKDINKIILNHCVEGTQFELSQKIKPDENLHIAVGHTYKNNERYEIFNLFKNKCNFPTIISPFSYVSKSAIVGSGSIVMHGCIINADCKIGSHTILNTKSSIDHNSRVGDFSHISTSVTVNGNVTIGNNVFVGSGSILRDSIKIPDNKSVKMSSIITKSVI